MLPVCDWGRIITTAAARLSGPWAASNDSADARVSSIFQYFTFLCPLSWLMVSLRFAESLHSRPLTIVVRPGRILDFGMHHQSPHHTALSNALVLKRSTPQRATWSSDKEHRRGHHQDPHRQAAAGGRRPLCLLDRRILKAGLGGC